MRRQFLLDRRVFFFLMALILVLGSISPGKASRAAAGPQTPDSYPPDPTADTPWSGGYASAADIQAAFTYARMTENDQLGTSLPTMPMLGQATWDVMTDSQKALYLINQERQARGVPPLHGVETNVTSVAQNYADFLMDNNLWGHYADGHDPWWRLDQNPAISACHDSLSVAENLAAFMTSGSVIYFPVERAVYNWMYYDSGSSWGHRHAILWYPYNDNSGTAGMEAFWALVEPAAPTRVGTTAKWW